MSTCVAGADCHHKLENHPWHRAARSEIDNQAIPVWLRPHSLALSHSNKGVPWMAKLVVALVLTSIGFAAGRLLHSAPQKTHTSAAITATATAIDISLRTAAAAADEEQVEYFAMCLSVKDQHRDIREWIEHHARFGVSKFYIFDNNSTPPMVTEFGDLVESGLVDYHYIQSFQHATNRAQLYVYDRCLQKYGRRHRFMAFLDADEFIVLKNTSAPDFPSFLRDYEDYGALVINWQVFGSSGLLTRPEDGALASYYSCLPRDNHHNHHVKTVANTQFTLKSLGPHHFEYEEGKYAVNERFERVDTPLSVNVTTDKIVLNHYVTKSLEEYQGKMARGSAMGNHKPISFFHGMDALATENCTYALHLG